MKLIEEKIREHSNMVYKIAFLMLKNQEDAEEVYQDTFIKLYENFRKMKNDEHMKHWLIRVTINNCKMLMRKRKRENLVELDENVLVDDANLNVNSIEAVKKLPEKYRIVIYLFYYEQYKVSEISQILKISDGTIKSQLSRARDMLKKELKEELDYE